MFITVNVFALYQQRGYESSLPRIESQGRADFVDARISTSAHQGRGGDRPQSSGTMSRPPGPPNFPSRMSFT